MIGFWKTKDKYGEFSNWYPASFKHLGVQFVNSEQAFMYLKARLFGDTDAMQKILNCKNPVMVKALGRSVKNFDEDIWAQHKYKYMVGVVYEKFIQNPDLQKLLLDTGDEDICEASPKDNIWGIGMGVDNPDYADPTKWKGENLLGKALMEVRKYIRNNGTI